MVVCLCLCLCLSFSVYVRGGVCMLRYPWWLLLLLLHPTAYQQKLIERSVYVKLNLIII